MLSNEYFLAIGEWYIGLGGMCSLDEHDRLLTPLPPNHMNALCTSFTAMMLCGGCVIQLDRFHPRTWWQTVREERATVIHCLGVMTAILLTLEEEAGDDFSGQVKFCFGPGSDPKHQGVFEQRFGVALIEAWASQKSFQRKDGEPPEDGGSNFRGQRRTNDTHASVTDPEAQSYRKAQGQEARLAYLGHALMDNRHGLAVDGCATQATGTAEREAAGAMIDRIKTDGEISLGADKGYDTQAFVERLRRGKVLPHIAQNTTNRRSAVPEVVAKTEGYAQSQNARPRIEGIFGWLKRIGGIKKVKLHGTAKVHSLFTFALAAYNLVRMRTLLQSQETCA